MFKRAFAAILAGAVAMSAGQAVAEVSPFGFAIGKASVKDVEQGLPGAASVIESGTSKITNGPLFKVDGNGFEIQGLQSATFIFTQQGVLDAVLMTMSRGNGMGDERFNQVLGHLSSQYKLVSKNVPFVGNKSAVLRKENVEIVLDSPHLSFTMHVSYATDAFNKKFKEISAAERRQKQQQEKSQF